MLKVQTKNTFVSNEVRLERELKLFVETFPCDMVVLLYKTSIFLIN